MAGMNKKAWNIDDTAFVIIGIILIFIVIITTKIMEHSVFEVTAEKQRVNDDLFLVNLLRTETAKGTIQDILIESYSQNDYSNLETSVSDVLDDAFGEPVCWTMDINGKEIGRFSGCTESGELYLGDVIGIMNINHEVPEEEEKEEPEEDEESSRNLIFSHGELLRTHVTWYFSPIYPYNLIGNDGWCSPTMGMCAYEVNIFRDYYITNGYPLQYYSNNIDNCLDLGNGWCCIMKKDMGFYEEVKCEGDGYVDFGDHFKRISYSKIGWTAENSDYYINPDTGQYRIYSKEQFVAQPQYTLACPQEFEKGTKFYVDFGKGNPYTGCYNCDDRGGGIRIENGVIDLDLYAGIGPEAQNHVRETTGGGTPDVYMGCSATEVNNDEDIPQLNQKKPENIVEGIEKIEIRLLL